MAKSQSIARRARGPHGVTAPRAATQAPKVAPAPLRSPLPVAALRAFVITRRQLTVTTRSVPPHVRSAPGPNGAHVQKPAAAQCRHGCAISPRSPMAVGVTALKQRKQGTVQRTPVASLVSCPLGEIGRSAVSPATDSSTELGQLTCPQKVVASHVEHSRSQSLAIMSVSLIASLANGALGAPARRLVAKGRDPAHGMFSSTLQMEALNARRSQRQNVVATLLVRKLICEGP